MTEQDETYTPSDLPTQEAPRDPPPALKDMMTCLIPALLAALPAFLDAFFKCIRNGNGGTSGYQPGDRKRCP